MTYTDAWQYLESEHEDIDRLQKAGQEYVAKESKRIVSQSNRIQTAG